MTDQSKRNLTSSFNTCKCWMMRSSSFWIGLRLSRAIYLFILDNWICVFETSTKLNQFYSVNLSETYLGGQVLNCVPFYEYLGINLDQSLSFKEHVTRLNNMISSQLGLLSRVLYSPRNDPDPEMIPNPEMIPKSTPKWSSFLFTSTLKWSPINYWNGTVFHHWIITNLLQRLRS